MNGIYTSTSTSHCKAVYGIYTATTANMSLSIDIKAIYSQ